mmetsp:Transcript_25723/g.62999  ORF Transcript_25723/g.62999 Transcript_25723/m.62999 type:complete len:86 (+) Transcript_25723:935-1192(+)
MFRLIEMLPGWDLSHKAGCRRGVLRVQRNTMQDKLTIVNFGLPLTVDTFLQDQVPDLKLTFDLTTIACIKGQLSCHAMNQDDLIP